jgi:hypothetical protein
MNVDGVCHEKTRFCSFFMLIWPNRNYVKRKAGRFRCQWMVVWLGEKLEDKLFKYSLQFRNDKK